MPGVRGHGEQVERAQQELADTVSAALADDGWIRRELDGLSIAVLTRPTGDGVMATAELARTSFQWPEDWPISVGVRIGVGYEPALNLMPLFTLDADAALITADEQTHGSRFSVTLDGPRDVATAAARLAAAIGDQSVTYLDQFPDPAAVLAALDVLQLSELPAPAPDGEPGDAEGHRRHTDDIVQRRVVLLAAMGRHGEARTLLSGYPSPREDHPIRRGERRFIRQVTRWLDAGGPTAAPVEHTLAQLPRTPKSTMPSWTATRDKGKRVSAARDAVKARLDGHTATEIGAMLTAEYSARSLPHTASDVAFTAETMHMQHQATRQPFGRTRLALKVLGLLKNGTTDAVNSFKNRTDEVPQWLRPPERATYPMARTSRHTDITLDPDALNWLEQAWTETPSRIGPNASVRIWLTRDAGTGDLSAHLGDRRVGTIPATDADVFRRTLDAAALFDEDPVARGTLAKLPESRTLYLSIPTPG